MTPKIALAALGATGLLFACDGDNRAPTAPPAPSQPPAPPPPPAFTVSFAETGLEVREGETLAVRVLYQVHELAGPAQVRLTASPGAASEADYELSTDTVEIPTGEDLAGEAIVELKAVPDLLFTEDTETLALAFASDGEAAAVGDPVQISIIEAGASPCPGVRVIGLPWREEEFPDEGGPNMLATTLSFEIPAGGAGTRLELRGPYLDLQTRGRVAESVAAFGINRWRIRSAAGSLVHELDMNWSGENWFEEGAEASLDLALVGGGCSGEPVASCTSEGCQIIP